MVLTYTFMHFLLLTLLFGEKKDVKRFSVPTFALLVFFSGVLMHLFEVGGLSLARTG